MSVPEENNCTLDDLSRPLTCHERVHDLGGRGRSLESKSDQISEDYYNISIEV